jgi:hypothetical protein
LLQAAFSADGAWLVRCSILSALAEQPEIKLTWLLELAQVAITDGDGTGAGEWCGDSWSDCAGWHRPTDWCRSQSSFQPLQQDVDHRVVAAALNGLQIS